MKIPRSNRLLPPGGAGINVTSVADLPLQLMEGVCRCMNLDGAYAKKISTYAEQPLPERDVSDRSLPLLGILREKDALPYPGVVEISKLKQCLLFPGGEGISIRDIDRGEQAIRVLNDEIDFTLLLPVVDLMTLLLEFDEDKILRKPPLILREPE